MSRSLYKFPERISCPEIFNPVKITEVEPMFFIESGLMGFIGGLIGVILGMSIGYYGTVQIGSFIGATIKPNIDYVLIAGALLGSFIIGSIAGIVPAMQAAKQNPVEALRG